MVETKRHGDAFDYYYSLGVDRGYTGVAREFKSSRSAVGKWGKAFNWQERVIQRDLEINKKVEEKTTDAIVNTKADYRADIGNALQPVMAMLGGVMAKGTDGKLEVSIEVETPKDFALIVGALDKLVKLDLELMGESPDGSPIIIINDLKGA